MISLGLDGKIAIVTGGSAGIGFAIASELAEAGVAVVLADVAEEGAAKAEMLRGRGAKAHFVRTNVAVSNDVVTLVDEVMASFGRIDILVNNAGIYPRGGLLDTSEEMWDRVMDINLKSMFLCSQAVVPHMKKQGKGSIVNLSSSHAFIGLPELLAYSVSKGGISTLTRNLAGALARDRIRVNGVNPGWVATEKELAERQEAGQSLEWLIERGKELPLGRMQTGQDAANAVLFLVSDLADQVTGQIIHADGGKEVATLFDDRSLEVRKEVL
ncbi:SDR family NAD(P)-dependent oxidoreductase [Paenibacillus nasutitermitis]|uniref:Oxidoreductase n=1 Tax=Paenibacillus nasutitermitis TaxID=1652958 RepID=A0A916Z7Q6_9BACL|nr:SDR family oxidoreductase [Paenibacillus nasutitermitis]GGD79914.1 oxidoreductase [Paenibacillus nasutitermitis]